MLIIPYAPVTAVRPFVPIWNAVGPATSTNNSVIATYVVLFPGGTFSQAVTHVKARIARPISGSVTFSGIYIGPGSTTNSVFNFSSSPTAMTIAGADTSSSPFTQSVTDSGDTWTDDITFTLNNQSTYAIAFSASADPTVRFQNQTGLLTGRKASVAEASSTSKTGYAVVGSNASYFIAEIDGHG